MRIAAQQFVFVNPRTSPGHVAPRATASGSLASAVKPRFASPVASAPTSPFASVFQTASQTAAASASQPVPPAATTLPAASATAVAAAPPTAPATAAPQPGIQALVSAIMDGSFQPSNVTDPSKLAETSPFGNATLSSAYYASDDTANQLAQLLGGKVVQMPAFGQAAGWTEPLANFIQLPNGQTVNAASLASYAGSGEVGAAQLTADLTQDINQGAAWNNYYQNKGAAPSFTAGYIGPAISGMVYPAGSVAADGTVINPAMANNQT